MKRATKLVAIITLLAILAGLMAACGGGIPEGAEVCRSCDGNKDCPMCDGDTVMEMGGLLGPDRKCNWCSHNPGKCKTCDGKGYVFLKH